MKKIAIFASILSSFLPVLLCLFVTGCKNEPEIVEPVQTSVPSKSDREGARGRKKGATATPEEVAVDRSKEFTPAPTPTPTPSPTPLPEPDVLMATNMHADNGTTDSYGGWCLWANGALQVDGYHIEFPVRSVGIEMRGDKAENVWPEVDLNMYNRTESKNYFPFVRDFITTSGYQEMRIPQDPPLAPGDYLITFRFYNNFVPAEKPGEDRNAYLRKLTFYP